MVKSLPEDFVAYTRSLMGDLYDVLENALGCPPCVSVRINPYKCDVTKTEIIGAVAGVPWCDEGVLLAEKPNFTFDPLMHAGVYYVQEASSMFVSHIVKQVVKSPIVILDLCAAPGGKATACRAALPDGSLLVCNEYLRQRANVLSENIQKFGSPDVIVTNNAAIDFSRAQIALFDIILADVPCSGEGMFRKEPCAIEGWSVSNVAKCRQLQRQIVADVWPCLKDGGVLIYSTCTYNAYENEENAMWIAETLGAEFVAVDVNPEWGITGSLKGDVPVCRFIPGRTTGEGLFVTVLRKKGSSSASGRKQQTNYCKSKENTCLPLRQSDRFCMRKRGEQIIAVGKSWSDIYDSAAQRLNVVHAGVTIGTSKGKDIIPNASLALSARIDKQQFVAHDVDRDKAISYLRKEPVTLPHYIPKGFVLLTYRGVPIGFEKNLGTRANNLYPAEWRIRSSHIPEQKDIIKNYEAIY